MKQRTAGIVIVLCLWTATAQAVPITFSYTGEIMSVGTPDPGDPGNPFPTPPDFGTPFSGVFTFDSTATDAVPADPATGSYASSGGVFEITLALGGLTFAYGAVSIGVTDGYSSLGSGDQYLVGHAAGSSVLSIRLTDFSEAMFTGDALPLMPPSLTGLFTEMFFAESVDGTQVDVNGVITSLVCTSGCGIPASEPASLWLLATGLAVLRRQRRGRRGARISHAR
jgi:hypothetical protein